MKFEIPFSPTSRYRQTELYIKEGKAFYGVWKPPDIVTDGKEKVVKVSSDQAGQLDLFAYREYGDSSLFWAIAYVNNIRDIQGEVVAGRDLTIPHLQNIKEALTESGNE